MGGGSNKPDCSAFEVGEQSILLGFVETMDFVDEQNRRLVPKSLIGACGFNFGPDFCDVGFDAVERFESGPGGSGDHAGEGGFARSGWSVENEGGEAVGFDGPPEEFAGSENVLLSRDLFEAAGAHAGGEGFVLGPGRWFGRGVIRNEKRVHGEVLGCGGGRCHENFWSVRRISGMSRLMKAYQLLAVVVLVGAALFLILRKETDESGQGNAAGPGQRAGGARGAVGKDLGERERGSLSTRVFRDSSKVITTDSGLQYEILEEGEGESPGRTDQVEVHYEGRLEDGTVFDSSYERGAAAKFGLHQVIPGWTEGVQLMRPGAKYRFVIPSELGYGDRGAGNQVPPGATLIFEVELIGFEKNEAP